MKTKTEPRGVGSPTDPHGSLTQFKTLGACDSWYRATYQEGRAFETTAAMIGRVGHDAIASVNLALKAEGGNGIGPDDLEAAKQRALGMRGYADYSRFCGWLDEYAIAANDEEARIIGVELELEAMLDLGREVVVRRAGELFDWERGLWVRGKTQEVRVRTLLVRGRLDRLDRGRVASTCRIRDYKLWGRIPSEEELEHDAQMELYNWLVRQNAKRFDLSPVGLYEKLWTSCFHGVEVGPVPADVRGAEDAERWARDSVLRILTGGPLKAETFGRHCLYCPRHQVPRAKRAPECATFARETGSGSEPQTVRPTVGEYSRLGAKIGILERMREAAKGALMIRLEKHGEPIVEDALRGEIVNVKGGKPVAARTSKPYSKIRVSPAGRSR